MSTKENYQYLCEHVDINSLMDWWIAASWVLHTDSGNIKVYAASDGSTKNGAGCSTITTGPSGKGIMIILNIIIFTEWLIT